MKRRINTILFLVVTVYIIPGVFIFWLDRSMVLYYFLIISPAIFPYYLWSADKKRSCKFFSSIRGLFVSCFFSSNDVQQKTPGER